MTEEMKPRWQCWKAGVGMGCRLVGVLVALSFVLWPPLIIAAIGRAAGGLVAMLMTGLIVAYVLERLRYFILVRSKTWFTIRLDPCCFSG